MAGNFLDGNFLAGNFLFHVVVFGNFMAGNFLGGYRIKCIENCANVVIDISVLTITMKIGTKRHF